MRCLCCGKNIRIDSSEYEKRVSWHKSCIRKFFGTDTIPEISLAGSSLDDITDRLVNGKKTIPGVQKKLSLGFSRINTSKLTLVDYPLGFILKPDSPEYTCLPEAEYLVMDMARTAGIKTVPFGLINSTDGKYAYITKRVDRDIKRERSGVQVTKNAMEDLCQLSHKLTEDKYLGSYERCGKLIAKYSSQPGLDLAEYYLRVIFSFVSGNSDMHLKNFSLIEKRAASQEYILSPAYDMLPVNIILPTDPDQMALTVNDKRRNIRRKDFLILAESIGLNRIAAERLIKSVTDKKSDFILMINESLLPNHMKDEFVNLLTERITVLDPET